MLNTFFDIKGTVHFDFIPQGQTVKQAYYVEIPMQLCGAVVHTKMPELRSNNCILHHDNASDHKALCQAVSGPKIDH
jgi:hypothetical protein